MPTRRKYPEAPGKASHYRAIATQLEGNKTTISSHLSSARTVNASAVDPKNVDGKYYDTYLKKRDDWIKLHGTTIATFDTFMTDLDARIVEARRLEAEWTSRIPIMETY